jgi:multimeric flavodoxin WrbA
MKIVVLGGSPKGNVSVTMQYIDHMKRIHPEHTCTTHLIAKDLRVLERDRARFDALIEDVRGCDLLLWAFPLYILSAHANVHRFTELVEERGAVSAFTGKYAATLTTSIHYYDHLAHQWTRAIDDDWGLLHAGTFSAEMYDLVDGKTRAQYERFLDRLFTDVARKVPVQRASLPRAAAAGVPGAPDATLALAPPAVKLDNHGVRIVVVTDAEAGSAQERMVARFAASFVEPPRVRNLNDMKIKGGCKGCLRCGFDNHCVYGDGDDIAKLYSEEIPAADALVLAPTVKSRYFSSLFKTYLDRRFQWTHQPQLHGKQTAWIVSGALSRSPHLSEAMGGMSELDEANPVGIVSDDPELLVGGDLNALLGRLAADLVASARSGYRAPQTFLGVAGIKLFRDEIYGNLRFVFQGDHRYYRKHGMYDFPQKNRSLRVRNFFMANLSRIPPVRDFIQKNMETLMLGAFKKVPGAIVPASGKKA